MAVSEQIGFDESTASGMTGVFPYTFKILRLEDMRVEIDGVVVDGLGEYTYTVTGIGEDAGGNVTITPNPTAGAIVLRALDAKLDRQTNYQYAGDLKSPVVNADFDRLWLAMQVLKRRALMLPITETGDNVLAADPASRAGKALIFDDEGRPIASPDNWNDTAANAAIAVEAKNVALQAAEDAEESASRVDLGALDEAVNVSTAQAGIATTQAGIATAQAGISTTQAGLAATAKTEAEAARDAAFVNADVYSDTATGLAGTTVGDQFQVVVGDEIIRYRHDAGPVATEIARYPSSAALDAITITQPIDAEVKVVFTDEDNNVIVAITSEKIQHPQIIAIIDAQNLASAAVDAISDGVGVASVPVVDDSGNLMALLSADELRHPAMARVETEVQRGQLAANLARHIHTADVQPSRHIKTTIVHDIYYGQSLSVGASSGGPIAQPLPAPYGRMFNGGINSRRGFADTDTSAITGVARTSLVPMSEDFRETGAISTAKMFAQSLIDEDGVNLGASGLELLISSAGVGGVNIGQLASTYFFRVQEDFDAGKALADAEGKSYSVGCVSYYGNESNQSTATPATFLAALRSMRAQIEAAATTAIGVAQSVPMFTAQIGTHFATSSANYTNPAAPVALAQLAAALNDDNVDDKVILVTPTYHMDYSDDVHLTAVSYGWRDAYFGLAKKRWFVDGIKQRPLSPTSITRYGNYIRIAFSPLPGYQMAVDTVQVPEQPFFGLEVTDSGGSPKTITSARLSGNFVELLMDSPPVAGDIVKYAFSRNNGLSRGLGNLRDTQGDFIVADPTGINKPLHNWVPLFSIGVI